MVFAIGIYTVVEGQNYSLVTGNDVISGGAILIAAGVVTMIITFVGIIGAIFKLRPLLALVSDSWGYSTPLSCSAEFLFR